jgi:hypothetical protein
MRFISILSVATVLVSHQALVVAEQDHHAAMDKRGAKVMGFDQGKTTHEFILFTDGGAIDVRVNAPSDTEDRQAIRSHLPHIAKMFGSGDFDAPMLVHDSADVPGTKVMSARKHMIRYEYVETPNGGRVNIVTTDREALDAVHAFLRFQIADHKTGDSPTVRRR